MASFRLALSFFSKMAANCPLPQTHGKLLIPFSHQWGARADLEKVLHPSGSARLELRSFCECVTPKSSDQNFAQVFNPIDELIDFGSDRYFPRKMFFHTLCRRKFSRISISGLWMDKSIS